MKHVRGLLVFGVIAMGACGLDLDVASDGTSDAGALADVHAPVPTGTGSTPPPDAAPDTGEPDTGAPDTGEPDTGAPDTGVPDSGPPACAAGTANCDGNDGNGCETSTVADVAHCGSCQPCGNSNAGGTVTCSSSTCGILCDANHANVNNGLNDGCEVDLRTDPNHCGTVATVCGTELHTKPGTCVNSTCTYECVSGYDDCNPLVAGCESSLNDVATCGSCMKACTVPGGTSACTAGTCSVATCPTNFADCNDDYADLCEVSTLTDEDHCGNCNTKCTGMKTCIMGVCN